MAISGTGSGSSQNESLLRSILQNPSRVDISKFSPEELHVLEKVVDLAVEKFKARQMTSSDMRTLKIAVAKAAISTPGCQKISDIANKLLAVKTPLNELSFLRRFMATAPVSDLFSANKRLTDIEAQALIRMAKLVVANYDQGNISPAQLKRVQMRMAALAEKDYRLQDANDQIQNIGKPENKALSTFVALIKTYIPLAKTVLNKADQIKTQFDRFTKTHNHAWNQQKFDIALDQLCKAIDFSSVKELETKENLSELETNVLGVMHALQHPEAYVDAKDRYQHMMVNLREALAKNDKSDARCDNFLTSVCRARFLENNMHAFCASMVQNMIVAGKASVEDKAVPKEVSLERMPEEEMLKAMKKSPRGLTTLLKVQVGKFKGTVNRLFDPHIQSNIPHHQLDFTLAGKKVAMIGMGTPTIEPAGGGASINPEFRHFIANQNKEECHLYVNLQNMVHKKGVNPMRGNEAERVDALRAFSKEYPGKFTFITLAQDSAFYKQEGAFSNDQTPTEFINKFIEVMVYKQEGFEFPLMGSEFWTRLEVDLSAYAKAFFGEDVTTLSADQRRNFIELAYPLIIEHVLQAKPATSMNITCKDGIDRGGKCQGLFINYLAMGENQPNKPIDRRQLAAEVALSRAPLVKAQPMIGSRLRRYVGALSLMDKADKGQIHAFWEKKKRPTLQPLPSLDNQTAIADMPPKRV